LVVKKSSERMLKRAKDPAEAAAQRKARAKAAKYTFVSQCDSYSLRIDT
jgi:hypothetical protein